MTHPQHTTPARRRRGAARVHARGARTTTTAELALALALAATLAACADRPTGPLAPRALVTAGAPAISIVKDPDLFCPFGCDEIAAGDSMRFFVRYEGITGRERYNEHAQWSVSDERIATISSSGVVTGRAPGEVELRATVGTRTATLVVTIAAARIARVTLGAPATTLDPRRSVQLAGTAIDVLGNVVPDAPLYWFAATPSVVTVDENGLATAVGPGDAIVMVFAEFGKSAWISLHVNGSSTAPALDVARIDVGGTQTCAVGAAGAASCWGWNYYGQLGDGTLGDQFVTFPIARPVEGDLQLAQVTAGDFHSCGLATDGAAWCWGDASSGRLGEGSAGGAVPRPARVASRTSFASIAAGGDHTCALDAQRAAWCWGYGGYGQLGTGSLDNALVPTRVIGDAAFAQVYPALWHSCALATDGTAWCWGANDFGQLGNGRIDFGAVSAAPSKVATRQRFVAMDSRSSHACGVTAAGEAYCWGRNDFGQAGDGTTESRARPVKVQSTTAFTAVATGVHHTCALAADGRAWCWGNNEYGQLGDNSLTSRTTPAPVHGTRRFRSLTAGNNVTCGVTDAGEAWCWGSSHFGMLGSGQDGWDTISAVPVRVIAK